MAQGKMKTKVKLPDNVKKAKQARQIAKEAKRKVTQTNKKKKKDVLQREVEKEIRKKIEADARDKATS